MDKTNSLWELFPATQSLAQKAVAMATKQKQLFAKTFRINECFLLEVLAFKQDVPV